MNNIPPRKIIMDEDVLNDEVSKWIDEENPEWTDEMFQNALKFEEMPPFLQQLVIESRERKQRGRPKSESKKVSVTIRYSENVIDAFKATGKGWQSRINAVLEEYVAAHPELG